MKKHLIICVLFFSLIGATRAQEGGKYSPSSGDISVAVLLGQGNFFNGGLDVPSSPGSSWWYISGSAPSANMVNDNSNPVTNMVGVEARYFVASNIAAKLTGGAVLRSTPARDNVPSIIDPSSPNVTWIPNYDAVIKHNEFKMHLSLAGEYHFPSKFDRVHPYLGVSLPFYYSRKSMYDPTVVQDQNKGIIVTDVTVRHVEIMAYGGQIAGGIDFYLTEGFYLGFEVKPFSYIYAYSQKFPAAGLDPLEADTHTYSFFSQPNLKLGFRF